MIHLYFLSSKKGGLPMPISVGLPIAIFVIVGVTIAVPVALEITKMDSSSTTTTGFHHSYFNEKEWL